MIENIKIFAADIDGTLALKGDNLMPKTRKALQKLHADGVKIGVASGRPLDKNILNKAHEWDLGFEFDFAIGMNGGDLWTKESQEIKRLYYLKPEIIREVLELIWDFDMNAIVYKDAYSYIKAKRMDDFLRQSQKRNHSYVEIGDIDFLCEDPTGKVEVHLKGEEAKRFVKYIDPFKNERWTWVKTFDMPAHTTIEFQDPRIHKGVALESYAKSMGIPLEEVIAFGDMQNDLGLIGSAGWGVCLLNGCDECKEIAQAVTEHSVLEDGVGNYLEDHWFNK
ncbi:MAG: Cof-type HAD-IIB family hydrolase [Firmicutes bacterium]|nr:Cof-type HAD-IIB family hydrolase [Bacillota bacterium]